MLRDYLEPQYEVGRGGTSSFLCVRDISADVVGDVLAEMRGDIDRLGQECIKYFDQVSERSSKAARKSISEMGHARAAQ